MQTDRSCTWFMLQACTQLLQVLVSGAPLAVLPLPSHAALLSKAAGATLPPIGVSRVDATATSSDIAAADVQGRATCLAAAVTAR